MSTVVLHNITLFNSLFSGHCGVIQYVGGDIEVKGQIRTSSKVVVLCMCCYSLQVWCSILLYMCACVCIL